MIDKMIVRRNRLGHDRHGGGGDALTNPLGLLVWDDELCRRRRLVAVLVLLVWRCVVRVRGGKRGETTSQLSSGNSAAITSSHLAMMISPPGPWVQRRQRGFSPRQESDVGWWLNCADAGRWGSTGVRLSREHGDDGVWGVAPW